MNKIVILIVLIVLVQSCNDNTVESVIYETGFIELPLNNNTNPLRKCFFIDKDYGWILADWKMFRTTNGCNSWMELDLPIKTSQPYNSFCFVDKDYGWVVGNGDYNAKVTTNGGNDWSLKTILDNNFYGCNNDVYFLDRLNGFVIESYHTDMAYIFHTSDGGNIWDSLQFPVSSKYHTIVFQNIDFSNQNTGFISGWEYNNDSSGSLLLKTTDKGKSWNRVETGIKCKAFKQVIFVNEQTGWLNAGEYIIKTIDGGMTWTRQDPLENLGITRIFFVDEDHGWLVQKLPNSMYGGVDYIIMQKTTDGGNTWHYMSRTTNSRYDNNWFLKINDIFFIDSLTGWIVTENGRAFKTTNGGNILE